jgi:transcriptional regulator with XRE-family HTH domain
MPDRALPRPRTAARRRLIEKLLAERAESGESYKSLEERSGIPAPTLAWWQSKQRERPKAGAESSAIEWVELGHPPSPLLAPALIEIVLPTSVVIRVPADLDADVLGRVLDAVASRC